MLRHAHTSAGVASGELAKGHLRRQAGTHVQFSFAKRLLSVAKARAGISSLHARGRNYGTLGAAFYHPVARGERGRIASAPGFNVVRKLSQRRCQAFAEHPHPSSPFVVAGFDTQQRSERLFQSAGNIFQS